MGNVSKLFPYRDSNGRLGFRGKIGVESKVSKFFPVRVDGRLMLRGKGSDGKILWGFPYRDASGRLMARTSGACNLNCSGSSVSLAVSDVDALYSLQVKRVSDGVVVYRWEFSFSCHNGTWNSWNATSPVPSRDFSGHTTDSQLCSWRRTGISCMPQEYGTAPACTPGIIFVSDNLINVELWSLDGGTNWGWWVTCGGGQVGTVVPACSTSPITVSPVRSDNYGPYPYCADNFDYTYEGIYTGSTGSFTLTPSLSL